MTPIASPNPSPIPSPRLEAVHSLETVIYVGPVEEEDQSDEPYLTARSVFEETEELESGDDEHPPESGQESGDQEHIKLNLE